MHDNDRHDMANRLSAAVWIRNTSAHETRQKVLWRETARRSPTECDVSYVSYYASCHALLFQYSSSPAHRSLGAFVDREVVLGCTKHMLYLSATSLSTFYGVSRGHLHRLRQPASCNSLGRSARRSWRRLLDWRLAVWRWGSYMVQGKEKKEKHTHIYIYIYWHRYAYATVLQAI